MSSPSNVFECAWQRSGVLLAAYLAAQVVALMSIGLLHIPLWAASVGVLLCLLHALRHLPVLVRCRGANVFRRLRRNGSGWQLWSERCGWQPVQLRRDSMALPNLVVIRFRLTTGNWLDRQWIHSVCVPGDAMTPDEHRRLRLRLKFSRRRWAAPE